MRHRMADIAREGGIVVAAAHRLALRFEQHVAPARRSPAPTKAIIACTSLKA